MNKSWKHFDFILLAHHFVMTLRPWKEGSGEIDKQITREISRQTGRE